MATPVSGQISKRERLGPDSALASLKGSDLSISLGHHQEKMWRAWTCESLRVFSATPKQHSWPSSGHFPRGCSHPMVMVSSGISNPSQGPWAQNVLQALLGSLNYWRERAQDLLLCLAFAVLFFVCWPDVAAAPGLLVEMKARLKAQPCPAPGWCGRETEGTQKRVGVDSHNHSFYTSFCQWFP